MLPLFPYNSIFHLAIMPAGIAAAFADLKRGQKDVRYCRMLFAACIACLPSQSICSFLQRGTYNAAWNSWAVQDRNFPWKAAYSRFLRGFSRHPPGGHCCKSAADGSGRGVSVFHDAFGAWKRIQAWQTIACGSVLSALVKVVQADCQPGHIGCGRLGI